MHMVRLSSSVPLLRLSAYQGYASCCGEAGTKAITASQSASVDKTKLNEQAQKDLGLKINLEGVDGLTIQARVTSSVQSGTGPDIICAINNWAQLYADSVADVSDVAEEIGKAQGGYYETAKAIAYDGKKWLAVPNTIVGLQIVNRTSWWKEIGFDAEKYPQTWEEW